MNLDTAFEAFDRDRDGTISPQEFRAGINALGLRLSNQQIEDAIRLMDPSGRGRIEHRKQPISPKPLPLFYSCVLHRRVCPKVVFRR